MEERLLKLDKYFEGGTSKKQQRNELMINGSTGALNMKISTRTRIVNESVEDQPKNIRFNKLVQTSVAEFRAECQISGLQKQPVAMAKDVNFLKDSGGESDQFEKIRRLPAVDERWDKKTKRKRSIDTILSRPIDSDGGVPKRAILNRVVDEHEHDARKSRSNCDGSNTTCPSPLTKKKVLRTRKKGSMMAARSFLGTSRVLENWENAMDMETEILISQERDNNRKPPLGQRPPKVPRTRKSNLMSPGSNQDDCSPSDGTPRSATNGSLKIVVKLDNLHSGIMKSVGGERQTKGKVGNNEAHGFHVQDIGPSVTLAKKNKSLIKEESVLRQGPSARRGLLISRCNMSPMGKELDNAGTPKLLQNIETGSKKNVSKPGRRLKRLSEYKGLSNDAPLQNSSPPDFTGESDDDQEEPLSAANHPLIPSPCSSPLWKKMEPKFAPISSDEKSLLSQQLGLDALPYEKRKRHTPHQQTESFFKKHDMDHKTSNGCTPFYQRVLSALIIEDDDDIDGLLEGDARNIQIQNSFSVSTSDTYHLNDSEPRKKARVKYNCDTTFSSRGQSVCLTKKSFIGDGNTNLSTLHEDVHIEGETSKSFHGCQYEQMCVDDRLLLELQCIGLCLDTLPGLEDKEDEYIPHEVDNLQTALHQQGSRRSSISLSGIPKVPKQAATARCHKLEKSVTSCFNEIPLKDILSAPFVNKPEEEHTASVGSQSDPKLLSEEASAVDRPMSNRGKNKKLLLNNIGTTISGRTKGKRSKRAASKPPRAPQEPKPKPRQKTDQPPTPKGKFVSKPTEPQPHPVNETNQSVVNNRRDIRQGGTTEGNDHTNPPPIEEDLDPIVELGVVGAPHDLDSLLSFNEEEEDLDVDFAEGLAVPDDDLTGLSLF